MASIQGTATKGSGWSFLDMLAQASSLAASRPALTAAAAKGSSSDASDHGSDDQTSGQPIAASENEAVDVQEIANAGSAIRNSAPVIAGDQNQDAEPGRAVLTIAGLASSTHSPSESKASRPAENRVTEFIPQASDQSAAQQIVVSPPTVTLSEVSFGRSTQFQTASPASSANPPAFPAVPPSNANSIAPTGSDGAGVSQSPAPSSASPAVPLSEVSFGRSTQVNAASATAPANLPAVPAAPRSNANSIAQTESDGAGASQSPAPSSASPAVPLSEVSFSRSVQRAAASPTASADLPTFSVVRRSNINSITQTGSDGADADKSPAPSSASPAVTLSEVSFGHSVQRAAASPTASTDLPAIPSIPRSNANSIAQTGSDVADASQSPAPSSASPAFTLSEVFLGRSMQRAAASATTPADLPAIPAIPRSNANLTAQTGSDGANVSQSSVPPSASPAWSGPSHLAGVSAAELVEQSAFAIGSTFSPGMILPADAAAGTSTDKASQFKSSSATFTLSSGDTNSSKTSPAQGSISADHSAPNGTPLPQHAPGDSSPATPLAIKPLETTAALTTPVSNHAALITPSQPHAASSASDVLTKAQDSADAAAEQLERTGSTAAAGINTARLMQNMSESEMRVGMHSAEFGDVSIRTSVSQQQLMAQINVDHGELGSAIAAHLPSLTSKLGSEFGLHASIEVNQLGGSVAGGNGQSSHQNHKMSAQSVPPDSFKLHTDGDPITLPGESLDDSRLDVRV